MYNQPNKIQFSLPDWLNEYVQSYIVTCDLEKKMEFVVNAAMKNVQEKTGGPFAAAVFEIDSGKLVSLGVNLVTTQGLSILHAEMVAISLAQRKLGYFDLGCADFPRHELVTSTEPCAMCFGAIPWSGVKHVAIGARGQDAKEIGFDEGSKPDDWIKEFETRKIKVSQDVHRDGARKVLQTYLKQNGHIYNSGSK